MTNEQRQAFRRCVNNVLLNQHIVGENGSVYLGHEKSLMQQHAQMLLDEDAAHPDPLEPFTYYVVAE